MKKIYNTPEIKVFACQTRTKLMAGSIPVGSEYGGTVVLSPGFDFDDE